MAEAVRQLDAQVNVQGDVVAYVEGVARAAREAIDTPRRVRELTTKGADDHTSAGRAVARIVQPLIGQQGVEGVRTAFVIVDAMGGIDRPLTADLCPCFRMMSVPGIRVRNDNPFCLGPLCQAQAITDLLPCLHDLDLFQVPLVIGCGGWIMNVVAGDIAFIDPLFGFYTWHLDFQLRFHPPGASLILNAIGLIKRVTNRDSLLCAARGAVWQ